MHREWRAAMTKDHAQVGYVRELIDLLEKNAPTVKHQRSYVGSGRLSGTPRRTGIALAEAGSRHNSLRPSLR
jgi:hypothetical protein